VWSTATRFIHLFCLIPLIAHLIPLYASMQLFLLSLLIFSVSHAMPRKLASPTAWTADISRYCQPDPLAVSCEFIVKQVSKNPTALGQAKPQERFCKWGYTNCLGNQAAMDNCNNSLSRCLAGNFACNGLGNRGAPTVHPEPDKDAVLAERLRFCTDTEGIGCDAIRAMVTVNKHTRRVAMLMMPFCEAAFQNCKTTNMGDCVNSLSRCLSGSWNCNGFARES
jgi:hypothetical protein